MKNASLYCIVATLAMVALSEIATADVAAEAVATHGDWTVFETDDPKECWVMGAPKSAQVAGRDGSAVEMSRSDISLYVFYFSSEAGEVLFEAGHPLAPDSQVEVDVEGRKFSLAVEGERAFTDDPSQDEKLIGALRAAATAVFTGHTRRGVTTDTFNLSGFAAAIDVAQARCQ